MSGSDKKIGVVGLTLFDLRRRGKVGKLSMVGTSGKKYPAIREHLQKNISSVYNNLDVSFDSFPSDTTICDTDSYKTAIDTLSSGDAITIFTPDTTHYPIALYAIERGIHVLITKPAVKILSEHQHLLREARKHNVFVFIEHHKRFDPAYADARARAKTLGHFNYFYSYSELCLPSSFFLVRIAFGVARHVAGAKSSWDVFHDSDLVLEEIC